MHGFSEYLDHPVESGFGRAVSDPVREVERKAIARIRFVACHQLPGLEKHLEGTAILSLEIAERLGLSAHEKENIWCAASVHDIGKISVNPIVLSKVGSLSEEEFAEVRSHTTYGERIFSGVKSDIFQCCAQVALSHHEHWNGNGYPNGISGETIPLPARIVSVADAYDCITAGRPYQTPQSAEKADAELKKWAGSQFDPGLVELFRKEIRPL